jgi:hypothetical protein
MSGGILEGRRGSGRRRPNTRILPMIHLPGDNGGKGLVFAQRSAFTCLYPPTTSCWDGSSGYPSTANSIS